MSTSEKMGPLSVRSLPDNRVASTAPGASRASAFDRWLLDRFANVLAIPTLKFVLWDGTEVAAADASPSMTLHIADSRTLRRLVVKPNIGFGDGYSCGAIQLDGDLVRFLEQAYIALGRARKKHTALMRVMSCVGGAVRRSNTLDGSRDNIHSHYDLGNDFYKLWLDPRMLYTCAYYPTDDTTLEQAQIAKMDHVCRKLRLQPGMSVVETGCGWGALAIHMAQHYGVRVEAYNISHQQILYARQRAKQLGLADRVKFIEDDYRQVSDTFDRFVSVGMLEHVGLDHFDAMRQTVDRCLARDGVGLIHSIGRNSPAPLDPWIVKRIFPGAHPPAISEMMRLFEPADFSILDIENLRLHYARTCADWLTNFERQRDAVAEMFDDKFIRAWRLYLAGSTAAFTTGGLQLFQVVFTRYDNNDLPATRAHLYEAEHAQV